MGGVYHRFWGTYPGSEERSDLLIQCGTEPIKMLLGHVRGLVL